MNQRCVHSGSADLATVARLAAEQLHERQLLRGEIRRTGSSTTLEGSTGAHIVVATFLRHLRAGAEDPGFASLHAALLGVETGGFLVAEQLALIERLERALQASAAKPELV